MQVYPKYTRFLYWSKLVTITGSAQISIQAMSLISGILVVRVLSPKEYALYTLSNTMLGTMILLTDGGISAGLMSEAGKVWQDKQKLGIVMATGLDLRKKFALWSLIIAIPVLFYFLRDNGASWLMSTILVLALVPAFFTSFSGTLLEIVPRLTQNIPQLQKIEVSLSIARLILLSACLVVFPWAFIAILSAGVPQLWGNKQLHKLSSKYASIYAKTDLPIRNEILKVVKRVFPGALYYCLTGQITLWMISVFGTTTSIAKVGALGRITMALALISTLFSSLVIPRFARLPDDRGLLLKRFAGIFLGLLICGTLVIGALYPFSSYLLLILGPNYSNLKLELMLNVVGGTMALIAGIMFSLILSRGWTINPLIAIPVSLVTIMLGITIIDISSIKGVFLFSIMLQTVDIIMYLSYGLVKILRRPQTNLASYQGDNRLTY